MLAEDRGVIGIDATAARDRLPQAMERLGYRRIEERKWERRKERCGISIWSLPDRCPATVEIALEPMPDVSEPSSDGIARRSRYVLRYDVRMPGQILANTDAKALELEADRLVESLTGGEAAEREEERRRLARLTLIANAFLTLVPAFAFGAALAFVWKRIMGASTAWGMIRPALVCGGVWLTAFACAAIGVPRFLNRAVETRIRYEKG